MFEFNSCCNFSENLYMYMYFFHKKIMNQFKAQGKVIVTQPGVTTVTQ